MEAYMEALEDFMKQSLFKAFQLNWKGFFLIKSKSSIMHWTYNQIFMRQSTSKAQLFVIFILFKFNIIIEHFGIYWPLVSYLPPSVTKNFKIWKIMIF